MSDENYSAGQFVVVMNDEEQWSIWPAHRAIPAGWIRAGMVGSRGECLEYIEVRWNDIRPRSVRKAIREES
jgi:MbtH protein